MDEKNATQVAWDSVKNSYEQNSEGNWVSKENTMSDRENIIGTDKEGSDSIGNRENNAGTMRGG